MPQISLVKTANSSPKFSRADARLISVIITTYYFCSTNAKGPDMRFFGASELSSSLAIRRYGCQICRLWLTHGAHDNKISPYSFFLGILLVVALLGGGIPKPPLFPTCPGLNLVLIQICSARLIVHIRNRLEKVKSTQGGVRTSVRV